MLRLLKEKYFSRLKALELKKNIHSRSQIHILLQSYVNITKEMK